MGSKSSRRGHNHESKRGSEQRPRGSSEYHGLSKLKKGPRAGYFVAQQLLARRLYCAGTWPDERDAALAVDRLRIYLGLDPENFPDEARAAGPASPDELVEDAWQASLRLPGLGSRFRGVQRFEARKRWRAMIRVDRETLALGLYEREDDAAIAHDRAALYFFGHEAELNIPGAGTEPWSRERLLAWAVKLRKGSREYTGVQRDSATGRWRASVIVPSGKSFKMVDVGTWDMPVEAARARDRAALHYVGPAAERNLPSGRAKLTPANAQQLRKEARTQVAQSMKEARTWARGPWHYICYRGRAMSLIEWAADLGISKQAIHYRFESGCCLEDVVRPPTSRRWLDAKHYEYKGRSLTLHGWERELGIPQGRLYGRVHQLGWSFAEALNTPVGRKRKPGAQRR